MAKSTSTPQSTDITLVRSHPTNPINASGQELPVPYIDIHAPRHLSIRGMAALRIDVGAVLKLPEGVVAQAVPDAVDAHMRGYQIHSGVIHDGQEVSLYIRSLTPRAVEFPEGAKVARLYFYRCEPFSIGFAVDLAT